MQKMKTEQNACFQRSSLCTPWLQQTLLNSARHERCAKPLHFVAKTCTSCNCQVRYGPRSGLGRRMRLHQPRVCKKKRYKARRREGDKCFFVQFFLARSDFEIAALPALRRITDKPVTRRNILFIYTLSSEQTEAGL